MISEHHQSDSPIRVWLIDDDPQYCQYVREAVLLTNGRIELEVFALCERAMSYLQNHNPPDVILLDVSLPGGMSGLMGLQLFKIHIPNTQVIMATVSEDEITVFEAFRHGAYGYVVKTSDPEKTIQVVYDAIEGKSFIDPIIAGHIIRFFNCSRDLREKFKFTHAEINILELIRMGKPRQTLHHELNIELSTLKSHLKHIYEKLQVKNLPEAIIKAYLPTPKQSR